MQDKKPLTQTFFLLRWMRTFWHIFTHSLSDLQYYVDVLNAPLKFSLKFVFAFYLTLSVVLTTLFTLNELPKIKMFSESMKQQIVQNFPDQARFQWQDEKLTSDSSSQLTITFPTSTMDSEIERPENLVIVDTSATQKPDQVPSLLYINQNTFYVNSLNGVWSDLELKEILGSEPLQIDKSVVKNYLDGPASSMRDDLLTLLPFVMFLFFSLGLLISRIIMIAINAIILQFLFQLLDKPIRYSKVFQLALHLLIPVEIINQITLLALPNTPIPMLTIAFWTLSAVLLWHFRTLQVFRVEVKKK